MVRNYLDSDYMHALGNGVIKLLECVYLRVLSPIIFFLEHKGSCVSIYIKKKRGKAPSHQYIGFFLGKGKKTRTEKTPLNTLPKSPVTY
jgi:hypothetical protein